MLRFHFTHRRTSDIKCGPGPGQAPLLAGIPDGEVTWTPKDARLVQGIGPNCVAFFLPVQPAPTAGDPNGLSFL